MSKRLLYVVDRYFPESSANTICSEFFIKELKEQGYIVDIIAYSNDYNLLPLQEQDGSFIIRIETYVVKTLRKIKRFYKGSWKELPSIFTKSIALLNRA